MPQNTAHAGLVSRPPTNLGLVGYWPMDEGVGNKVIDASGQNNTGTITGATWTNGKHGKALSFSGESNKYATVPLSKTGFTNLTISFWFRPTGAQSLKGIYSWADTSTNGNPWIIFQRENATTARWYFNANYRVSLAINDNTWYHTVATYNGTTWVVYLNGVQSGSYVGSIGSSGGGAQWFGCGYNDCYNGKIDDVRLYNRALTAAEISKLYSSGEVKVKQANNNGLVGYWSMNEGRGTIATDSSGQRNNGTITGASWTNGKKGGALNFNGSTNKIDAGNNSSLQLTTGTISAWVKTTNAGASYRGVVAKQLAYGMFLNANEFGMYDWTAASWRGSGYSPNDGKWHFLVCTFQSGVTNGTLCYADGILKLTTTMTVSNQTVSLQIAEANASQYFNGSLDDVRIYNRALSASEIAGLYQSGSKIENAGQNNKLTNGLVGLWSFNAYDISGTTAYDRSGQGNNGTLTNMSATTSPVAGKVGQGLKFDGVDDQINISPSSSINNLTSLSLSAWVKTNGYGGADQALLISKNDASLGGHGWYFGHSITTARVTFGVNFAVTDLSVAAYNVIDFNVWNHWVVTWDGSTTASNVHIYKNGTELSKNLQTNGDGAYSSDSARDLIIANHGTLVRNFDGLIDEVRIYNRALSADEVKQLYRMGQ